MPVIPVPPGRDPDDPVQQAVGLVYAQLEALRRYHAPADWVGPPLGYSQGFDRLLTALNVLAEAIEHRAAEARAELGPWHAMRRPANGPEPTP